MIPGSAPGGRPGPVLHVHATRYAYTGNANPSAPGGITLIYKDLIADQDRNRQVTADVCAALAQGRNCIVLTSWTAHLQALAGMLRQLGRDPVVLKGGMDAKERASALKRLETRPGGPPPLAVATGPYAGEGFDCPALDTRLLQGQARPVRRARPPPLRREDLRRSSRLPRRAHRRARIIARQARPRLHQPRLPDPRKLAYTASADTVRQAEPEEPSV
jgi:hypothetical protein